MKYSSRMWVVLFCILSILMLSACAGDSESSGDTAKKTETKSGEKTMFIGASNPPMQFVGAKDNTGLVIGRILFEPLLGMVEPLVFTPKLAESFETTDNQTFTIKLNPDAKWTDGQQITAEDVAFTLNWVAHPKSDSPGKSIISFLEGVTPTGELAEGETTISGVNIVNDKELTIKARDPVDPNYVKELLGTRVGIMPNHVLKDIAPEELNQHPFTQNPDVSSGAFKFVKYEKDQYVELVANEDYYSGAPKLDKIFIKLMPGPNLVAQLKSGEVHMNAGEGIGMIPVQDYETVENMDNIVTKSESQISFQTMMFNTKKITDKKVRQAIAHGINRQLIVDNLLKGYGEVVDGPYTSVHPYHDKSLEIIDFNPDKAKELLKEANWDGSRELELVVPVGNTVREHAANIIAENLKDVGINIKINKFDFPTVMQKGGKEEFDLLLMGFPLFVDPDVSILYGGDAPYNFTSYNNSEANELLIQGKTETDQDKRIEIYDNLQKIWQEDVPFLTTYSEDLYTAVSKKVKVGEPKVFGAFDNIHEWDIED